MGSPRIPRSRSVIALMACKAPMALESFMLRDNIPALRQRYRYHSPLDPKSPEARVLRAINDGDEETAIQLVRQPAFKVNARDEAGISLLHHTAQVGMLELMDALRARGANPDARTVAGETVLNYVITSNARSAAELRFGNGQERPPFNRVDEVVDKLIGWKVNLELTDDEKRGPALNAAAAGDVLLLGKLRHAHASLYEMDKNQRQIDYFAASGLHQDVSHALLVWGIDPRDWCGRTTPRDLIETRLSSRPSDQKLRNYYNILARGEVIAEAREISGLPIEGANLTVVFNNIEAFRQVYENRALEGDQVLSETALKIVGRMAGYDTLAPGSVDDLLFSSSFNGDEEGVEKAYARQASPKARNHFGRTPIMMAALNGEPGTILHHRNMGVDLNAQDCLLNTALMYAVVGENEQTVRLLLSLGANPLQRNWQGMTAREMWALSRQPAQEDLEDPETFSEMIAADGSWQEREMESHQRPIAVPGFIFLLESVERKWTLAMAQANPAHATASAKLQ